MTQDEFQAKKELLEQLDNWVLDRRAKALLSYHQAEESNDKEQLKFYQGIVTNLRDLASFLSYMSQPLITEMMKNHYDPNSFLQSLDKPDGKKAKIVPFIPRDALFANKEDRNRVDD